MEKTEDKFKVVGKTKILTGSILTPETGGLRFILSPWNLAGAYQNKDGSFVNPQSKLFERKWMQVKKDAKTWYAERAGHKLGEIFDTAVQSDVWVIQMLCQKEDLSFDLKALETCLEKTCSKAKFEKATIHVSELFVKQAPELLSLLEKTIVDKGLNLYIYKEVA